MSAKGSLSAGYLGRVRFLDGHEPFGSAPPEGALVIQVPPGEAISDFGAADHMKHAPFLDHLYRLVAETSAGPEAKPRSFGVYYRDVVPDSDIVCTSLRCGGMFCGLKQGGIQTFGAEVLLAKSTKLHRCASKGIRVPLYASALEVLGNHAWLNSEFAYGGTEYVSATLIEVESEEAEADIVSRIREVAAEPASNQGVGHGSGARGAMAEKLPKRAHMHFGRIAHFGRALHSCASKVLNQMAVLFYYGFCDGRSPNLKTTFCLKKREEGFFEVMACSRKILAQGVLGLARMTG